MTMVYMVDHGIHHHDHGIYGGPWYTVVRPADTWGEYAVVMRTNAVAEIPLWFCSSQLRFLL
jgi:hypothetical protein